MQKQGTALENIKFFKIEENLANEAGCRQPWQNMFEMFNPVHMTNLAKSSWRCYQPSSTEAHCMAKLVQEPSLLSSSSSGLTVNPQQLKYDKMYSRNSYIQCIFTYSKSTGEVCAKIANFSTVSMLDSDNQLIQAKNGTEKSYAQQFKVTAGLHLFISAFNEKKKNQPGWHLKKPPASNTV